MILANPLYIDETSLRRRIQELQHYRRLGIMSSTEIEKYENELYQRVCFIAIFPLGDFLTLLYSSECKKGQYRVPT